MNDLAEAGSECATCEALQEYLRAVEVAATYRETLPSRPEVVPACKDCLVLLHRIGGEPMTNEELERIEAQGGDPLNSFEDARDGLEQLGANVVRLAKELREARASDQSLRDAMYRGHAGLSCQQIAEMADRNIKWCAEAQVQRDIARRNEKLWRAFAKALNDLVAYTPEQLRASVDDGTTWASKIIKAGQDLRDAGIDPYAP